MQKLDIQVTENPIFIHIPKTGGMSIAHNIMKHLPLLNWQHKRVSRYDKSLREKQFVFSFVRNPYDRLVSAYHYLTQGLGNDIDNKFGASFPKNFESFILNYMNSIDTINLRAHLAPMVRWLDEEIDFIGKYENMQQDYESVCRILNIPIEPLPVLNRSNHQNYKEYYTIETKNIVDRIYHEDITRFNYAF